MLLDLPPEIGLERAQSRARKASGTFSASELQEAAAGTGWNRFEEQALDFHRKVRDGFLELSKDKSFVVLDASASPESVSENAIAAIRTLLSEAAR